MLSNINRKQLTVSLLLSILLQLTLLLLLIQLVSLPNIYIDCRRLISTIKKPAGIIDQRTVYRNVLLNINPNSNSDGTRIEQQKTIDEGDEQAQIDNKFDYKRPKQQQQEAKGQYKTRSTITSHQQNGSNQPAKSRRHKSMPAATIRTNQIRNQLLPRSVNSLEAAPAPRALALQSVSVVATDQQSLKCALILQRTYVAKKMLLINSNSNDYELNNNNVNVNDNNADGSESNEKLILEPTGKQEKICITYDDVNLAIREAKQNRAFVPVPQEEINSIEPKVPIIAQLGELNQEVTKILAKKFDLSSDEILNGLPLIDMSRTDFWPICPLMVRPVQCDASGRFRSFTGHCNNLKNPVWGAAQTPFVRYLAPKHPDGIQAERSSVLDGSALPSPRLVTSIVHRDHDQPSSDLSLLIMVWGQIIDHDVALAAPPRGKFEVQYSSL